MHFSHLINVISLYHVKKEKKKKIFHCDCAKLSASYANSFSDTTQSITTGTPTTRPSMFPELN